MKFSTTTLMMMLCGQNFVKAFAFNAGSRPLTAGARSATASRVRVLSSAATEEAAEASAADAKPQDIPDMEEILN
eukprot:jgi/Psemu1/53832/gm1.53832_g